MRAHKFSLVWLDYLIDNLGLKRKEYIGGEAISGIEFEENASEDFTNYQKNIKP